MKGIALAFCLLISLFSVINIYRIDSRVTVKASVKGVQTNISPAPTFIPTPTPISQPELTKTSATSQENQYGGWYWRANLGRAQRWMGVDSGGSDIWSDTGDPKLTPVQTSSSTSTSQQSASTSSIGQFDLTPTPTTSSTGTTVSIGVTQSVVACSTDGSNPNIPKCQN